MSEGIIGIFEKWMKFVKLPLLTSLSPLFQKTSFTQEAWMIEGTKQMFISFLKKFYWNIVDLQYCLSLVYSTVDQLYIQIFIIIQLLSCVGLFAAPWIAAHQASLSFTISWSLFKLMSSKMVTPSNHLILCRPLLLLPSIVPRIRVFPSESVLRIR